MSLPKKVTFSDTLFVQEIDGELVLLDTETEHYYGLDEVGKTIWETIAHHKGDIEAVIADLLEMYEVDEATLRRDMENFLNQLEQNGLVTFV
jgi:hypothetical protein